MQLELQAIRCGIAGVKHSLDSMWSAKATKCFESLVIGKRIMARVISVNMKYIRQAMLKLWEAGQENTVADVMVEEGFAKYLPNWKPNTRPGLLPTPTIPTEAEPEVQQITLMTFAEQTLPSVVMSHMESAVHFYVQWRAKEKLKKIEMDLNHVCTTRTALHKAPPVSKILAVHLESKWLRAKVLAVRENKAKVRYIDYGNVEKVTLDRMRYIDSEHLAIPCQAILCGLQEAENLTHLQAEKFYSLLNNTQVRLHLVEVREGISWADEITTVDGISVTQALMELVPLSPAASTQSAPSTHSQSSVHSDSSLHKQVNTLHSHSPPHKLMVRWKTI